MKDDDNNLLMEADVDPRVDPATFARLDAQLRAAAWAEPALTAARRARVAGAARVAVAQQLAEDVEPLAVAAGRQGMPAWAWPLMALAAVIVLVVSVVLFAPVPGQLPGPQAGYVYHDPEHEPFEVVQQWAFGDLTRQSGSDAVVDLAGMDSEFDAIESLFTELQ